MVTPTILREISPDHEGDPKDQEYLVGVKWIDDRPREDAYWETGMYANQNTVTKFRNRFTLERLYDEFDVET